jgi:hypothetical protein
VGVDVVSARSQIAAGLLLANEDSGAVRAAVITRAEEFLRVYLHKSTVWQSADLPPQLRGQVALGQPLSRWRPQDVTVDEAEALEAAWRKVLPPLDRGIRRYLRVRVDSAQDARRLRQLGSIDGLIIVPSLESRGSMRSFTWRWPFRVGVVKGPLADAWLHAVRDTSHYGYVFDAELFDADATYDIAIVSSGGLLTLSGNVVSSLGRTACVVVAADGPVEGRLMELEGRIEPSIAVAVAAPPADWWQTLLNELSHDVPIDAAVERVVRTMGVDALIAGPNYGMNITASAHWFAAVAPYFPQLAPSMDSYARWDWQSEGGGSRTMTDEVRAVRAQGGNPVVRRHGMYYSRGVYVEEAAVLGEARKEGYIREEAMFEEESEEEEKVEKPSKPRRLVARVWDGNTAVESILPPRRALNLAIRVAIPESGDVAADKLAPAFPAAPSPTVELEVVVRGDVWAQQPDTQMISISREKLSQPSTWAVFPFTTPDVGRVVSIEIILLYQGKPLQAATYVSPVRAVAVPGERPTLTTFALSGPDGPSEELRPVGVTLDGRGAELVRVDGSDAKVLIAGVQQMLDRIDERVSRVLGVRGAPDSFDDSRALELLITLAGIGTELERFLAPLDIGDEPSINVIINADTRVLPLELVYAGPPPLTKAELCDHVSNPPTPGHSCDKVSRKRVCPYAFWGLHRSIARTIQWNEDRRKTAQPWTSTISASSVLYGATVVADVGASEPLPSASVLATAQTLFQSVTRVKSWTEWRRVVKSDKPNLLIVLGHTMVEGGSANLYIGKKSQLARLHISKLELRADDSPRPLVLLIACATAALGDPFGSLPGALTAKGAGAVVGTLSKIVGPHGAAATMHLLQAVHDLAGTAASVGDAVAAARRSLIDEGRPVGLILVSHGEMDTKLGL